MCAKGAEPQIAIKANLVKADSLLKMGKGVECLEICKALADTVEGEMLEKLLLLRGKAELVVERYDDALKTLLEAVEESESDDSEVWYYTGLAALYANDLETAQEALAHTSEIKPQDAKGWDALGSLHLLRGSVEEAEGAITKSTVLRPEDTQSLYNLGTIRMKKKRYRDALECFRKAVELQPGYSQAWNNMGVVFYSTGKFDEAVDAFEKAKDLRRDWVEARKNLALSLWRSGIRDEALKEIGGILTSSPNDPGTLRTLGCILYAADEPEKAVEALERSLKYNLLDARTWFYLGLARAQRFYSDRDARARDGALEAFEKVISLQPEDFMARSETAKLWLYEDLQRAQGMAEEAVRMGKYGEAFVIISMARFAQGDLDSAVKAASDAVELSPSSKNLARLSMLVLEMGDHKDALKYASQATDADPMSGDSWHAMYRVTLNEEHLDHALKVDPSHVDSLCDKAWMLLGSSRTGEAVELLRAQEKTWEESIDKGKGYMFLGLALSAKGERENALDAFGSIPPWDAWHPTGIYGIGETLLAMGRPEDALKAISDISSKPRHAQFHPMAKWELKLMKRDPDALRGKVLFALGKDREALDSAELAISRDPESIEAWALKGKVLAKTGEIDSALSSLERAHELDPSNIEVLRTMMECLIVASRTDEARDRSEALCRLQPDNAEAWALHSWTCLKIGDREEALGAIKRATVIKENDPSLWNNLGDVLYKMERFGEAGEAFGRAIGLRPDYDAAILNLARSLIAAGRTKKGISMLKGCLERRPDWRDATLLLAEAQLKVVGIDEVKGLLSPLVEKGDADALYLLALGMIQESRYDEGENYITQILHVNEKHIGATYLRGIIAEARGSSSAKEIYTRVLQMDPDHAGARRRLNA
jgi:tetratricopeptide (TPR) repeat protein